VQVDPMKPTLRAPTLKRFKLKESELLSRFAYKLNLRRYNKVYVGDRAEVSGRTGTVMFVGPAAGADTRPLFTST
jgi:hypothetical protein